MKTKKEELQAELTRLNALRKQVKEKLKALPVLEVGKEEWKDVFQYEGLYQVSNFGNVKSLARKAKHSSGTGFTTIKEKILSKSISQQGYYKVRLSKDGVKTTKLVHHLVAESFLNHTERSNSISIDHIDENKLNNNVNNLQVISKKDNTKKSYENSSLSRKLSTGSWYKYNNSLFVYNIDKSYGFKNGVWLDSFKWDRYFGVTEATQKEVENALINEAINRGFINGAIANNSIIHDVNLNNRKLFFKNEFEFDERKNTLRIIIDDTTTWSVFKDGQWAEIIDKPEEKPKVVTNGRLFKRVSPNSTTLKSGWRYVDKQEAIKLLFND